MLEMMEQQGIAPDTITFTSLIHGCAQDFQVERAFLVFKRMLADGLPANHQHFSFLLWLCRHGCDVPRAFEVFNMMAEARIDPDEATFSALLHVCVTAREIDDAFNIVEQMIESGMRPAPPDIILLANGATEAGRAEAAANALVLLEAEGALQSALCREVLLACSQLGETSQAARVFALMTRRGFQRDYEIFHSLLLSSAKYGDHHLAQEVWANLRVPACAAQFDDASLTTLCSLVVEASCVAGDVLNAARCISEAPQSDSTMLVARLVKACQCETLGCILQRSECDNTMKEIMQHACTRISIEA